MAPAAPTALARGRGGGGAGGGGGGGGGGAGGGTGGGGGGAVGKKTALGGGHKQGMASPAQPPAASWKNYLGVFKYSRRAISLVWSTSKPLTIGLAACAVI